MTPDLLAALQQTIDRYEQAAGDVEIRVSQDMEFHQLLARASGNPVFEMILSTLGRLILTSLAANGSACRARNSGRPPEDSGGTLGHPLKRPSTPVPAAADLRCGQRRQHPHRCRPDASSATILRLHHPHPCQLNRDPRTVVSYRGRCPSSRWRSGHGEQVAIAGSEVSGQAGAPSGAGSYPQCPQDAVPLPRTP